MFLIHAKRHSGVCENAFCSKDSKPYYGWFPEFLFFESKMLVAKLWIADNNWKARCWIQSFEELTKTEKQDAGLKALKSWQKLKAALAAIFFGCMLKVPYMEATLWLLLLALCMQVGTQSGHWEQNPSDTKPQAQCLEGCHASNHGTAGKQSPWDHVGIHHGR